MCKPTNDADTRPSSAPSLSDLDLFQGDDRSKFALESYKEAMNNLRHHQNTSLRIATWGTTSLAILAGWLLKEEGVLSWPQRLGLALVASGFVLSLWIVQRNCGSIVKQQFRIVIQVDKAFGCFTKGLYLPNESLFPVQWSMLKRTPFLRRVSSSLMSPLLIGLVIVLGIIFFH